MEIISNIFDFFFVSVKEVIKKRYFKSCEIRISEAEDSEEVKCAGNAEFHRNMNALEQM